MVAVAVGVSGRVSDRLSGWLAATFRVATFSAMVLRVLEVALNQGGF